MICKCFSAADDADLIGELMGRGYYVDKTANLLGNMDTDEMIDELKSRGVMVDKSGATWQLYYDAISACPPNVFKQKLSYFFEKTIDKRI